MKTEFRKSFGAQPPCAPSPFWNLNVEDPCSRAVITDEGRMLSFADLQNQVDAVKEAIDLPAKGLVFILCNNSVSSLACYLACLQTRHTALLLPYDMEKSLLDPLVQVYQPDLIWVPQSVEGYEQTNFELENHRLYRAVQPIHRAPIFPELALLLSTSGSTGNPKLVRLSYANLQANAGSITDYLELGPDERPITSLPMYYSYGLSVINSHLHAGSTLLLTGRKLRSPEFWDFFREHQATSMAGVPYVYQMLRELGFENMELPSLRMLTQAGGHLDVGLQDHFMAIARRRNIRYFTMYGQTEATARIAYVPPERADEGRGSIGIAIPGGNLEIVDGELVYHGPNVMLGYAESRDDFAKGDELQGRLFTGDIARIDELGFCYLLGRKKRFIKLMGLRINTDDVERQLTRQLGHKCVVLGTDMHLAVVTTRSDLDVEIVDFIRKTYRIKGSLCSVNVVDEIPVLATGKVDYETLKRLVVPARAVEKTGPFLYAPKSHAESEPRGLDYDAGFLRSAGAA